MKKSLFAIAFAFCILVSTGCNNKTQKQADTKKDDYNTSVTLGGTMISTISKVVNSNKKINTDFNNSNVVKLVYEKNSISDEDFQKYVEYFYDECYAFTNYMGIAITFDDSNDIEFAKKISDDKVIVVVIKENITGEDSQYTITYSLENYNEDLHQLFYNKIIIDDETGDMEIVENDKCI